MLSLCHSTTTLFAIEQECVLIRHPRHGEYALAFVTGECYLEDQGVLTIVYVPTNHMYVGDIYMLQPQDVLKTGAVDLASSLSFSYCIADVIIAALPVLCLRACVCVCFDDRFDCG